MLLPYMYMLMQQQKEGNTRAGDTSKEAGYSHLTLHSAPTC